MSGEVPDSYIDGDLPADGLQPDYAAPLGLPAARPSDNSPMNYVSNPSSSSLNLSAEQNVMRDIEEIFRLEEEQPKEGQEMGGDDEEEQIDLEDQQRRTAKLKGILPTLAQLWWSNSEQIDPATEKLADGSRDRESKLFQQHRFLHLFHISSVLVLTPARVLKYTLFLRISLFVLSNLQLSVKFDAYSY
jgi:hypothetical protein